MAVKFSQTDFTQIPWEDIEMVGQWTMLHRDLFNVSWLLGRYCNYSCSYCWPYASTKKKDWRSEDVVLLTLEEIKKQARERGFNSFHFSFSGGEPTVVPTLPKLLDELRYDLDNCNWTSTHLTSNISRKLDWWENYVSLTKDFHRVSITASYHKEHVNTDQKRLEFADKLHYLQTQDVQVTINQVMVPERFDQLWEDAIYFHDRGINVTLKPQSDPTASFVVDGYTPRMLEVLHNGMPQQDFTEKKREVIRPKSKFKHRIAENGQHYQIEMKDKHGKTWRLDQAERFNAFGFNKFKDWTCSSGYRSIIIREPDGHIKRSYSCSDAPLGHIQTGFSLFDQPMPCISESCVSSADSKIPKRKPTSGERLWSI